MGLSGTIGVPCGRLKLDAHQGSAHCHGNRRTGWFRTTGADSACGRGAHRRGPINEGVCVPVTVPSRPQRASRAQAAQQLAGPWVSQRFHNIRLHRFATSSGRRVIRGTQGCARMLWAATISFASRFFLPRCTRTA